MAPISENNTDSWRLNARGSSSREATGPYYYPGFYYGGLYGRYRRLAEYRHYANRPSWSYYPSYGSGYGSYGGYGHGHGSGYGSSSTEARGYRRIGRPDPPAPLPTPAVTPEPTPPPTPEPEPEAIPEEKLPDLNFVDLDLMAHQNRFEHHTVRYSWKGLIVRRGQAFKLGVKLSETFNKDTDRIVLKFKKGTTPDYSKGTCFLLSSEENENDYLANGWTVSISDVTDKLVTLAVTPDPDSVIGHFKVSLKVKRTSKSGKVRVDRMGGDRPLIVLFNAFIPEDDAYMEKEKERDEYVMNDTGLVYTSVYRPRNWNFGQFEKYILDVVLYLMDSCEDLPPQSHGSIVQTLRAMSAMVNAIGDNGVLIGNWSGDYEDGTSPTKWNGSVSILRQYWNTKRPVKYGQCWVFAAVLATVTRALGLPGRTVTNFSSAHDTDRSMTIDKYIDSDGKPLKSSNRDSTWNFHVWNECYCRRPDLPEGYDGWQAFDSTPQETSDRKYQCGPCPVSAIFKGDVHIPYDGRFIFAEVNSDTIYWMVNRDGSQIPYEINTTTVGRDMSTKVPGMDWRLDLTKFYKGKEGSTLERQGAINAMRRDKKNWAKIKEKYEKTVKDWDVVFDLKTVIDANEDCHFHINIKNNSTKARDVRGKMHIYPSYNVGVSREDLWEPLASKITVNAGATETVEWDIPATEYFSKLDDDASLLLHAAFFVEGTTQIWSQAKVVEIMKPDITVTLNKEELKVGDEFEAIISFTNPVSVDLTGVEVDVEGPGIVKVGKLEYSTDDPTKLKAEKPLKVTAVLKAERPGDKAVVASFDSRQLMGLSGVAHIKVTGEEPDD